MHLQKRNQLLDQVARERGARFGGLGGGEQFLEAVEGGEAPVGDLDEEGVFFLVGRGGGRETAEVFFDDFDVGAEVWFEGRVEVAVEDFVDEPAGDAGAADGCHFFGAG